MLHYKQALPLLSWLLILLGCSDGNDNTDNSTSNDFDLDEAALSVSGYTKIYEDNFSSDLSNWNIWTGGAYNDELQFYQANNLTITNGILEIKAKQQTVTGPVLPGSNELSDYNYTSGRIESDFEIAPTTSTQKIRISARIKLAEGYGMWPAFWSYGDPWPTHGEIDILEATGGKNNYVTNYFYGSQPGIPLTNDDLTSEEITTSKNLTGSYHVYEVIWTKNSLTYLLDDDVVAEKRASEPGQNYIPEFYAKPQHIILNLAVGGTMFNNLDPSKVKTSSMYIDWVKVFKSE